MSIPPDPSSGTPDVASAPAAWTRPVRSHRLRKWSFRLLLALLGPALVLGATEAILRICGYGYPTSYFVPAAGRPGTLTGNDKFAWQFVPPARAPRPEPLSMTARKAPGTFRIFVFGESAAMGIPGPSFSFSRCLEAMLREQYPKTRFEVINTGMMGINSHIIRLIAPECAKYDPDLFIVYMGNNDAGGFLGPTTVGPGSDLPSTMMGRLRIFLRSTRLGELIANTAPRDQNAGKNDLRLFLDHQVRTGEQRYLSVADRFEDNLSDVVDAAHDAGCPALLCTVAVNLRDNPPFGSLHREGLSADQKKEFDRLYALGAGAETAGHPDAAAVHFASAAQVDPDYAEVHFRLARCLMALGKKADAQKHYALARDLDTIQFRTDSRQNAAIRNVAAARQASDVQLIDLEKAFAARAHDGVPGSEFFYDHVHMTFDGNFAAAEALLPAVQAALPESVRAGVQPLAWTRDKCAELLCLTPIMEAQLAEPEAAMMSTAPFTNQFDNAERQRAAASWLAGLRARAGAADPRTFAALYERTIARHPSDWRLHQQFGSLLLMMKDSARAEAQFREALAIVPESGQAQVGLGVALLGLQRYDQAEKLFRDMLQRDPRSELALINLGDSLAAQKKYDEAIATYRRAHEVNPNGTVSTQKIVHLLVLQDRLDDALREAGAELPDNQPGARERALAGILRDNGRPQDAIELLRKAAERLPKDAGVRVALGNFMYGMGKPDEAAAAYNEALQIDPRNVVALDSLGTLSLNAGKATLAEAYYRKALAVGPDFVACSALGNMEATRGNMSEAERLYQQALKLRPDDATTHCNLGAVLMARKQKDDARQHLAEAVRLNPGYAIAHDMLAQVLERDGSYADAAAHYRRALELNRREPRILMSLAWILATSGDAALRNCDEAVKLGEEAAKMTHFSSWRSLDVLSAAYAGAGNFERAAHMATVAAQLAKSAGRQDQAAQILSRAQGYKENKPYRLP